MNYLKLKIKNILFNLKKFNNKLFYIINKKKFNKKIAIVSCDKWKNKVKEDILLKIELNKKLIDVDIISWQDKSVDYNKYDALIIRSIWGYQDYIKSFIEWLNNLNNSNIKVFNDTNIIVSNLNKYEQFKILDENKIPHIETTFINKDNLDDIKKIYDKHKDIVIKPIISGSGNNTFIISDNIKKNNIEISEVKEKFNKVLNEVNNYIMVQPFIKEIDDGELSVVVIDAKISHAAIRYTNIFNNLNQIKIADLKDLDDKVLKIVNKCMGIKEYKDSLYMRIDLVKINDDYKIMELELVEPQLFFEFKQNKSKLIEFVEVIKNNL